MMFCFKKKYGLKKEFRVLRKMKKEIGSGYIMGLIKDRKWMKATDINLFNVENYEQCSSSISI